MIRNAVECLTGLIVHGDVAMTPEHQMRKNFYVSNTDRQIREKTSMPGNPSVPSHTAEVFWMRDGAALQPGGWLGGDSFFGLVVSCVELKKRFNVYSTFVVKQHHMTYFPMYALHGILKARHGESPAGNWVVMTATIADAKVHT